MPRSERPRMASYGVPTDSDGVLPWSWAEERLVRGRNYWVSTVDAAGRPHTMPVWGLWDIRAESFWFSCAPDSLKARNLSANPQVTVAPDDSVEVVSVEGHAALRDVDDHVRSIADAYALKYEPDATKRTDLASFLLQNAVVQVTPVKAFGIIEREDEFAARATRWVW